MDGWMDGGREGQIDGWRERGEVDRWMEEGTEFNLIIQPVTVTVG